MPATLTVRVEVPVSPVLTRSLCDRCDRRARFRGLGGTWCPGCWTQTRRAHNASAAELGENAHLLANRYGLDCWEQIAHSLADDQGWVHIRQTAAPVAGMYYHPEPAAVVDAVLASSAPHQRAQLQLQTINRALWGLALQWGEELQDYPRDGAHSPDAIPWGLVRWAESDIRAYRWMLTVALRLRTACMKRFKRNCEAGRRIAWLVENTSPPRSMQGNGHLSAPLGCLNMKISNDKAVA